jgi:type VI secretion system secreted protein Hcp
MQRMRVRWLMAVAISAGIMLTTAAAWGAANGDGAQPNAPGDGNRPAATDKAPAPRANAEQIHMLLSANGVPLVGDSFTPTRDRRPSSEVLAFENAVQTPRDAGSGMATGRRQYQPLLIRKRIDKSSPLLMKALTNGDRIDGQIQFFRPSPGGGGMEHYYTITITGGRLVDYKLYSSPGEPGPMEELHLTFDRISWTYVGGGITHEDTWSSQK